MASKARASERYCTPPLNPDPPTLAKLERYGRAQCTREEMVTLLNSTPGKLRNLFEFRKAQAHYNRGRVTALLELREAQFKLAETNVPMVVLLSKTYLSQEDRRENDDYASFESAGAAQRVRAKIAAIVAAEAEARDREGVQAPE